MKVRIVKKKAQYIITRQEVRFEPTSCLRENQNKEKEFFSKITSS